MPHNPQFDDRLSGYLDGELSSSEAAQIERELAADPALRQLRDDLLSLRGELQSLPKLRPSSDLTGRILAAAAQVQPATVVVRPAKKSLPAWATFAAGMAASAALMLVVFSLFGGKNPVEELAQNVQNDSQLNAKDLNRKDRGEGEYVGPDSAPTPPVIVQHFGSADDVPQIAAVLEKGASQAGVIHVLRLQVSMNQLQGGALDRALLGQKFIVSGVLDRKELLPHVALAYRSLPQSRLIAGEESTHQPVAEIVYLELPAERVSDALAALASAGKSPNKLAPEVRLAAVPALIEVASTRNPNTGEGEPGSKGTHNPKSSNLPSTSDNSRPLAIRIGAKQLKNALGDNLQESEFAGPGDEQVEVLLFVRVLPQ